MSVVVIGLNHRTVPLELLERMTINDAHLPKALADLSGQVPMVCLVLGPAAGHGALAAPLSDFVVMTESASMFTGGPPLVKAATGEDVTKEELGGARICAEIAGSAHNVVPDDASALALARRYLGYFPQHRGGALPTHEGGDTGPRALDDLVEVIPPSDRKPYAMHEVIEVDQLVRDDARPAVRIAISSLSVVTMMARGERPSERAARCVGSISVS